MIAEIILEEARNKCYNFLTKVVIHMKKLLIHTEYLCILNILALPFVIMFYERGTMMLWALLIFLDVAELMLQIDESKLVTALTDADLKQETQRIKIYMVGIVLVYLYILFARSWVLLVILLINDAISSLISWLYYKYIDPNQED